MARWTWAGACRPSRALAQSLGVSRDTVEAAYGQLHAEGFIERRTGSGSFVSEQVQRLPGRGLMQSPLARVSRPAFEPTRRSHVRGRWPA